MKAAVLLGPNEIAIRDDWPDPECGPDEVIVKIKSVGLCGTDLNVISGRSKLREYPWVLGHEGGGEIVEIGSEVKDRHVGQRVAIEPNFPDGTCEFCLAGRTSLCQSKIGSVGFTWPGLLSEYFRVPARFAWPVPDSLEDVALGVVEPFVVGVTAVERAGVCESDDVLVVGSGPVGQYTIQAILARKGSAYVTDVNESRVNAARNLGALEFGSGGDRSFSYVFETAGVPAAWLTALNATKPAGVLTVLGMTTAPVEIAPLDVVTNQITIKGNMIYDHPVDFGATINLLRESDIDISAVISAVYSFEETQKAIDNVANTTGKTVITFD